MIKSDRAAECAQLVAEFRALRERQHENMKRELETLAQIEAALDDIAADPQLRELFTRVGVETGLDVTSRKAIQRRRAELERRLGRA